MDRIKSVLLMVGLGLAAHASEAIAAPAYCDLPGMKDVTTWSHGGYERVRDKDPRRALAAIIAVTCNPDVEAKKVPKEIEAVRAVWTKQLDLTDDDWADVAAWALLKPFERAEPRLAHVERKALSALDTLDQYAEIIYTKFSAGDAHYMIDALEPRLSEPGRLAYIQLCLESKKPIEWAMCQGDIDALDPKKLSADIRLSKRPGYERAMVRIALDLVRPKLVEHATAVKELLAQEPGYETLFKIAADARKAYKVKPELLELALAMDDASALNSTRALAGCDDKTWPALASAIGAIPAAKFGNLKEEAGSSFLDNVPRVLLNDPDAYLASLAHATCHSEQADAMVQALAGSMHRWPGFRGPRNAAHTAMVAANVKLDERGAQIDWPKVNRPGVRGANVGWSGGRGPVAAVKQDGKEVTVEFVKKLRKESVCTDWKDTNKVVAITSGGTVVYDYICLKRGTITVNDASPPNKVDARYARGVKPGVHVSISQGVVAGVWDKPGKPPLAVLGVPVK